VTHVAVAHLIFPKVSIDIIRFVLIALVIIPWLETLFNSVELPGGVTLEFQDLEKIEKKAKKMDLVSDNCVGHTLNFEIAIFEATNKGLDGVGRH